MTRTEMLRSREAWRICLICGKRFWSESPGHRTCKKCKRTAAYKDSFNAGAYDDAPEADELDELEVDVAELQALEKETELCDGQ